MRLDIEGHRTPIPPHLLSVIVEHLGALNTSHEPTFRALVTLRRRTQPSHSLYQTCVTLHLPGRILRAQGKGAHLDEVIAIMLATVEDAVRAQRPPIGRYARA